MGASPQQPMCAARLMSHLPAFAFLDGHVSSCVMADSAPAPSLPVVEAADGLRALFDKARDGDERALAALCHEMRPRLYRVAFSIVRDRDEADDLAQEALIRAVTKRFLFLGRGSVAGWMTRIVSNLAKNRLRDGKRRKEIMEEALPDEKAARGAQQSAARSPDDVAAANQTRARLLAAMEALPERQRDVVRLHIIASLDFGDVAEALGMTEANARVTFSHAKKKLMETMA
jgi:RNA polymerase sigma-70 factor (ECF subfamily)